MISIELWRARIGAFNNKRSRSRCSLSSTYFTIYVFFHWTRHKCRNVSREEHSQLINPHTCPLVSTIPPFLPAEERSPAIETVVHESSVSSGDLGGDSLSRSSSPSSSSSSSSSSSMSLSSYSDDPCFLHRSLLRDAFIALVIAIISQLLIMAGDVETNPGPKHRADEKPCLSDLQHMTCTNEDGRDFRLKDRVKPYWRDLAVALKFPPNEITIMEHKDDNSRVHYLFHEWLRGAIQEKDSKPVTWETLITALKNANIQQEAKILEEHFVEMPHSVSSHKRRHDDQQTDDDDAPPTKKSSLNHVKDSTAGSMGSSSDTQTRRVTDFSPGPLDHAMLDSKVSGCFHITHHPSGGFTMWHGPLRVSVDPDVPNKLRVLLEEYADMLVILRMSKLSKNNFSKLKLFLYGYCSLESIEQCTSLRAVVDLLIEHLKIYIFNIETLNASCKYLDDPIKISVQVYKQHLCDFLTNTSIKEFARTLQTKVIDSTGIESITLKLDESRVDDTLKALNTLIYHFFGNCSKALNHCETGPGCVCITWLVSTSLVSTVRTMAEQHSQKYLASQGVLELVIGLRIAPITLVRDKEQSEKLDTYQRMIGARDVEINAISSRLSTVQKQNKELD